MKKTFQLLLIIMILQINLIIIKCYSEPIFFNPGIKLGYVFGENGGFIWGIELSVFILGDCDGIGNIGFVADIDFANKFNKYHVGIEMPIYQDCKNYFLPSICFGPTILSDSSGIHYGFSVIPYDGLFLYPYYNFSYFPTYMTLHEIGAYLKMHFPLTKIKT